MNSSKRDFQRLAGAGTVATMGLGPAALAKEGNESNDGSDPFSSLSSMVDASPGREAGCSADPVQSMVWCHGGWW